MKRILFVAVTLVGCGKKADYTDAKPITSTVTTADLTYTVAVPEGLPKDDREPGDWSNAKEEYDHVPKVFTGNYPLEMPTELEAAKKETALSPDKGKFVRAEKRPNGWAVTVATDDKHRLEASTLTKLGAKIVKCHAIQVGDGEIGNFDKTRAMLEAICDSIKAK